MKTIFFIIIPIIICLAACAPKIVPLRTGNVKVQNNYAWIKQKDFEIAIESQHWNIIPENLENYFTVFYLIFRNRTNHTKSLDIDSFVLIDGKGEQYNLYSSDEVINILYGDNKFYDIGYYFSSDSTIQKSLQEEHDNRLEGLRNIKLKSFQFRKIRPQAQESGYIFFEKIKIEKNSVFDIYYKSNKVRFAVTK